MWLTFPCAVLVTQSCSCLFHQCRRTCTDMRAFSSDTVGEVGSVFSGRDACFHFFFSWQVASPTTRGKKTLISSSGMYRQPEPTRYPEQINPLVVLPPPHTYPLPVFLRSGATQSYTGEFCPQQDPQMYVQPCYNQIVASWSDFDLRTDFQGLFFGKLYHLVQDLEYDVILILLFSSGHQMY